MDRVNEEAVLVGVCGCVHVLKVMWMAWCRSNWYIISQMALVLQPGFAGS